MQSDAVSYFLREILPMLAVPAILFLAGVWVPWERIFRGRLPDGSATVYSALKNPAPRPTSPPTPLEDHRSFER
jgi:hypothetical protein